MTSTNDSTAETDAQTPSGTEPTSGTAVHHGDAEQPTGFDPNAESLFDRLRSKSPREMAESERRGLWAISQCGAGLEWGVSECQTARMVFGRTRQNDLLRGRSIITMAGASVYLASRIEHQPVVRSKVYNALASAYDIEEKQVQRDAKYIKKHLSLPVPVTTAVDYIPQFVEELIDAGTVGANKQSAMVDAATQLVEATPSTVTSGKSPNGVAAAAIYGASITESAVPKLTQAEVSSVSDVSEVTIRNTYRDLIEHA